MIWLDLFLLAWAAIATAVAVDQALGRRRHRRFEWALRRIQSDEGLRCPTDDCGHVGCISSQRSWEIADKALHPGGKPS